MDRTAAALAAAVFLVHLVGNPHYGFFRDELYFIVCGRHPDFGYVDQPPLVPFLAAGSQAFGTSLVALRAIPALLAAAMTYTVWLLAAEMGGGRFARLLGAMTAALAPVLMAFGTMLGPDSVQMCLWPVAILCIARALRRSPVWWLAAGAALGVAGEAKYSAVMLAAALLAGLALSPSRRALAQPWLWAGVALAGLILLPNALWQWVHGLPMLELLRNGQHGKNLVLTPMQFLLQQLLLTNPMLAPIWVAGLVWCLVRPAWRWLGFGVIALLAIMIALHGKAYYPAPIYSAAFAAGAVAIEAWITRAWPRRAAIAACALAGALLAPLTLPFLPEPLMLTYLAALARIGIAKPAFEHHRAALLGQDYADMHGWQALADQVTALYRALPDGVRARARVFASNYGEAAAIDVLAPKGALPPAIGEHNQYWLWGPRDWDGTALIDINGDMEADAKLCGSVTLLANFTAPYVMPFEDGIPIILCQGLTVPVGALWPRLKHYN
jgi:hypothetical protein